MNQPNTGQNPSAGASTLRDANINNPKIATVSAASNGFVVSTNKTEMYGQDMHIASDAEGVLEIIKGYFA